MVAAGAWSGRLARTAGVRLPLQGGKGYAAEWDPAAAPVRMPLYLHDHRVVANPMADRTRMTGGLLLDGLDESFDARRVRAIARAAEEVLGVRAEPRLTWRGLRPCTPDGLPVIGESRGVVFATGHGMLGVTLGPLTGRLVASIVAGRRRTRRWRGCLRSGSERQLRLGGAREPPAALSLQLLGLRPRNCGLELGGAGGAPAPLPTSPPF